MSPTTTDRPTLAILGAGGDLTERLLLPGLGTLLATDPRPREAGGVPLEEYEAGSDGPAVGDRRE